MEVFGITITQEQVDAWWKTLSPAERERILKK